MHVNAFGAEHAVATSVILPHSGAVISGRFFDAVAVRIDPYDARRPYAEGPQVELTAVGDMPPWPVDLDVQVIERVVHIAERLATDRVDIEARPDELERGVRTYLSDAGVPLPAAARDTKTTLRSGKSLLIPNDRWILPAATAAHRRTDEFSRRPPLHG